KMAIANRTGGQILVSVFGKNLETKEVDIYQNLITTGEPVSFSTDPLSSGSYDWITVRDRSGSIIGQVQGDEVDPAGELSFSVLDDFFYLNNDYIYGSSKNRLLNLFNGEAFKNKGDVIVPIGTNGTDKTKTSMAKAREMNLPYKILLHNEGAFIKNAGTADENGVATFRKNPFEASFNQTHKTVCLEFRTTTGDGQVCKMFPIVAKNTAEWAEGDTNQFNLTAQRGCDVWERDDFWTEVYKVDVLEENSGEVYVDYIVNGGTEPTVAIEGETACVITSEGVVSFKKKSASAWAADSAVVTKMGTRVKSNKVVKAGTEVSKVNAFVAIGNDGKAIRFSTDVAVPKFYAVVLDLDKTTGMFEEYSTEQ
ncbi:MAG: hypothetical protein ACRCZL_07600, partial [Cetobacterium sp.]